VTAFRRTPLRTVAAQPAATVLLLHLAPRSISTRPTARLTHGLPPSARATRTRTASVSRATLLSTTLTRQTAEHPRSALRHKLCTTTTSFPRSPTPTTSPPDTSQLGITMAGTATCSTALTVPVLPVPTSNTTALTLWRPTTRPKRSWVRLLVLSTFSVDHLQHLDPIATFRSRGLSSIFGISSAAFTPFNTCAGLLRLTGGAFDKKVRLLFNCTYCHHYRRPICVLKLDLLTRDTHPHGACDCWTVSGLD
jgi:hypothetical protein